MFLSWSAIPPVSISSSTSLEHYEKPKSLILHILSCIIQVRVTAKSYGQCTSACRGIRVIPSIYSQPSLDIIIRRIALTRHGSFIWDVSPVCDWNLLVCVGGAHALRQRIYTVDPFHREHSCAARPAEHTYPTTDRRGDPRDPTTTHSTAKRQLWHYTIPQYVPVTGQWTNSEVTLALWCATEGDEEVWTQPQPQPFISKCKLVFCLRVSM